MSGRGTPPVSEASTYTGRAGHADAPLAPGLYLVATPVGNLEDITLRALRVLRSVDRVACEDTRQTAKLLHYFGIDTPTVSYHMHNERGRAEELVAALRQGGRIAVVSDAGTPGIADPGEEIARLAIAAGVAVYAVPGASAILPALVASGLPTERFAFHGFLPSKSGERRSALERLREIMRGAAEEDAPSMTRIVYETPHRILDALADVEAVFGTTHRIALARELTKLHEEFLRGTVGDIRATLASREHMRGEIVLLLSGNVTAEPTSANAMSVAEAVRHLMKSESLDEKDALKRVARERGIGKSEIYREWQRSRSR